MRVTISTFYGQVTKENTIPKKRERLLTVYWLNLYHDQTQKGAYLHVHCNE